MDNKTYSKELEERTKRFAIFIIRLSAELPGTPEGNVVRNQITKAGTSIGANYREANRSRSRADFRHKIKICESEASETQYWLEIVTALNWLPVKEIEDVFRECSELLAIFTSIGKTLRPI
ncbi:MAG: four helix bundle protein [Desulfatiglandaceae bacterium]